MTKLKPTFRILVQEQNSNKTPQRTAVSSSYQTVHESLLQSLQLSPDFPANRYDNGLRAVHITSIDGKKRVHTYHARAPVGSMSCKPPVSASAHEISTPIRVTHDQARHIGDRAKLSFSEISTVCIPPEVPKTTSHEEDEDGKSATSATLALDTSTLRVSPASYSGDWDHADSIGLRTPFEKVLCRWIVALKTLCVAVAPCVLKGGVHLIVPFLFRFMLPWTVWRFFFVPWMVCKGLKMASRTSQIGILGYALFVLVLGLRMVPGSVVPWALGKMLGTLIEMGCWLFSAMW